MAQVAATRDRGASAPGPGHHGSRCPGSGSVASPNRTRGLRLTLKVFRVCPTRHAETAFSGDGARTFGGRWNPPGTRAIYCAENRSLAALEILVHLRGVEIIPKLTIYQIQVPDSVSVFIPRQLPQGWDAEPVSRASQDVGAAWIKAGRTAVLRVPSAVVPEERNFVLNPEHPDFPKLVISKPEPFVLDPRLLER